MRDLQLVIFDCDGVLVDSEVISNEVLARALTEQGLPTTLAQSRRDYQGLLLADIDSRAQAKLGRPLEKDWLERYERNRTAAFRRELRAVPGVAAVVRRIETAGVAVCVASQGKLEKIRLSLKLTKLDHLFPDEVLFSAYSVPRGKPDPDLFLHAAQEMAAGPSRCVVVEDTPSGVTAAVAAGMRVFGYASDSDAPALRQAGAEVFATMEELPGLLGLTSPARTPPARRS
ncbi:MAG TPA: HAD family hydrolase [Solirubrobacteraceae bacterium]